MTDSWEPANRAEAALQAAYRDQNLERIGPILAELPLLVAGETPDGAESPQILHCHVDGKPTIPAYTSVEAAQLPDAVRLSSDFVEISFADLARQWPNAEWSLFVNPGAPIATWIDGIAIPELIAVVFAPVNDVEAELARVSTPAEVIGTLLTARVYLPSTRDVQLDSPEFPWWSDRSRPQQQHAVAFTSVERLRSRLGVLEPDIEASEHLFVDVVETSQERALALSINPGTPYTVWLPDTEVRSLATALPSLLSSGITLQALTHPSAVADYIDRGHGVIAGRVHVQPTDRRTPVELCTWLELTDKETFYTHDDGSVHVIRWHPEPSEARTWLNDPSPRMTTHPLPPDATLVRIRADATEELIATYDRDHHRWTPSS